MDKKGAKSTLLPAVHSDKFFAEHLKTNFGYEMPTCAFRIYQISLNTQKKNIFEIMIILSKLNFANY